MNRLLEVNGTLPSTATLEFTDAFTAHASQGAVRAIGNAMQAGIASSPARKDAAASPPSNVNRGDRTATRTLYCAGQHRSRESGRKTNPLVAWVQSNGCCRRACYNCRWQWATSSIGRAPRSQCGGCGFKSHVVHQPALRPFIQLGFRLRTQCSSDRPTDRIVTGSIAARLDPRPLLGPSLLNRVEAENRFPQSGGDHMGRTSQTARVDETLHEFA